MDEGRLSQEEIEMKAAIEIVEFEKYREIERRVLGESWHTLPSVMLQGVEGGDVADAAGTQPCEWSIHAEDEKRGGIHLTIRVLGEHAATVTVHAPDGVNPWDEAQDVGAALVWSRIRGVLRDRARAEQDSAEQSAS